MSRRPRMKKQEALAKMKRVQVRDDNSDDDYEPPVPPELLFFMNTNAAKKKRKTPKKITPSQAAFFNDLAYKRHWHSDTGCPCMIAHSLPSTSKPRKTPKPRKPRKPKSTANQRNNSSNASLVELLSDDEKKPAAETAISDKQVNNIKSKVNSFFKCIESSDEEEVELKVNANKNKDQRPKMGKEFYEILSDSDDDKASSKDKSKLENSNPHTSAVGRKDVSFTITEEIPENKPKRSDIMTLIDDIMKDCDTVDITEVERKKDDVQLLETLSKKTEELLSSAATLFNEGDKKPEEKKEEKKPPETKSCPICLENIDAERPAMATFCGHIFCQECITHVARTNRKCPTCRKAIGLKKIHPIYF